MGEVGGENLFNLDGPSYLTLTENFLHSLSLPFFSSSSFSPLSHFLPLLLYDVTPPFTGGG